MQGTAIENLREANLRLRAGLARLRPEANHPTVLKPEDLSGLLEVVSSAGNCRRSLSEGTPPNKELEKELSEYRNNIEELAKVLLTSQGQLLAEKARLDCAQSQVAAASAWAKASKDTL